MDQGSSCWLRHGQIEIARVVARPNLQFKYAAADVKQHEEIRQYRAKRGQFWIHDDEPHEPADWNWAAVNPCIQDLLAWDLVNIDRESQGRQSEQEQSYQY